MIADQIGRHRTIILTLLGVALTMPVYALTTNQTGLLWFGPRFGAFTAFFGLFGSYLGEMFPSRARATGAGFCFNVGRGVSAFAPFGLAGLAGTIGFTADSWCAPVSSPWPQWWFCCCCAHRDARWARLWSPVWTVLLAELVEGEGDPVGEFAGEVPAVLGEQVRREDAGELHAQVGVESARFVPELVAHAADDRS